MASVIKKREMVEENEKFMLDNLTMKPHDIICIVNYVWEGSFARVALNKKAIAERGWCLYN